MVLQPVAIRSSWSATDEFILGPKINELVAALNALEARVGQLELTRPAPAPPSTGVVIPITVEQAAAILALPAGSLFDLVADTAVISCRVEVGA
jgi:hypothetical protein